MTVAKSILTISRDQPLQSTRTRILQQAGYTVSAALNDKDAISFVKGPTSLDLVLVCHSVPEANRILLAAEIKKLRPRLPILMLYNGYDPTSATVDGSLHSYMRKSRRFRIYGEASLRRKDLIPPAILLGF